MSTTNTKTTEKVTFEQFELRNNASLSLVTVKKITATKIEGKYTSASYKSTENFYLEEIRQEFISIWWITRTETTSAAFDILIRLSISGRLNGFLSYAYKAEFLIGLRNKDPPFVFNYLYI
jgi:hypothetical protein